MLLGGGGYHHPNAARCWTRLTATCVDEQMQLAPEIPEYEHFPLFGPDFLLEVETGRPQNENSSAYLMAVKQQLREHIDRIPLTKAL